MNKLRGLKVIFKGRTLQEFARRYLTDLSATGMFVRTGEPLPVGTKLRFDFRLEDNSSLLSGTAIVLWMAEESPELNLPSGMELRFDSFDPASEERFEWLQMERRGVTVGREIPLEISSSSPDTLDNQPTDEYDLRNDSWDTVPSPVKKNQPHSPEKIEELINEEVIQRLPTQLFVKSPPLEDSRTEKDHDEPLKDPRTEKDHDEPLKDPRTEKDHDEPLKDPHTEEDHNKPLEEFPTSTTAEPFQPALKFRDQPDMDMEHSEESDAFDKSEGLPLSGVKTALLHETRRSSWIFIAALLIVAVLVGSGVALLKQRNGSMDLAVAEDSTEDKQRIVRIITVPNGAAVLVDGKPAGTSPVTLTFKGTVKVRVQHANFLSVDFEVRKEDPEWIEQENRWVMERTLMLHPGAEVKTVVAVPIHEPDQGTSARDLRSASAQAPADAGPSRVATNIARARPESRTFRAKQRPAKGRVVEQEPDVETGTSGTPDPEVAKDIAATVPPDNDTIEPADHLPSNGAQKEPAGKDEPGAPVAVPPEKKIKVPSWVEKKESKAKLKKPTWMEKNDPTEEKK